MSDDDDVIFTVFFVVVVVVFIQNINNGNLTVPASEKGERRIKMSNATFFL